MLSTMLTVMDGFPRALQLVLRRFRHPETPDEIQTKSGKARDYWIWIVVLSAGAMLIIVYGLKSLTGLVDLATILSFLTAPFLGILTFRAIMDPIVPEACRPGRGLRALAVAGIGFLSAFLLFFLYYRFLL